MRVLWGGEVKQVGSAYSSLLLSQEETQRQHAYSIAPDPPLQTVLDPHLLRFRPEGSTDLGAQFLLVQSVWIR